MYRLPASYREGFYVLSLLLIAAGLPLSKFFLGLAGFVCGINWVWEGEFVDKWNRLKTNKVLWLIFAFFLLHVIGVFWSPDTKDAWRDVRIKLPLLIFPLAYGTIKPIRYKFVVWTLGTFVAATLVSAIVTYYKSFDYRAIDLDDVREASRSVSLIRLSLMGALSVFIMTRWAMIKRTWWAIAAGVVIVAWYSFFFVQMQSLTGVVVMIAGGAVIVVAYIFRSKRKWLGVFPLLLIVGFMVYGGVKIQSVWQEIVPDTKYDKRRTYDQSTRLGNPYTFNHGYAMSENGNLVLEYVCWEELDSVWLARSGRKLYERDAKGHELSNTLIRYMASKGLRKDADGLMKLSDAEIREVENGVTNCRDGERNVLERRLYQVLWEVYHFSLGGNPSGNSIGMRLAFLDAAYATWIDHKILGVGTAGQTTAYKEYYNRTNSQLNEKWRWMHAHNQFVSVAVTLGLTGLLLFIAMLTLPVYWLKRWTFGYVAFFTVLIVSFFTDDTLETNQGIMFYILFTILYLFAERRNAHFSTKAPHAR
jgi:O-antigen ligase